MSKNSFNSFLIRCEKSGINFHSVVENVPRKYVLVHRYLQTGHNSIVAFSDSYKELEFIVNSHPRCGSIHHAFYIVHNENLECVYFKSLGFIKDECLINICKNVGELLAVGEYAMLKKSYSKSLSWFDKAKNTASFGAKILENY